MTERLYVRTLERGQDTAFWVESTAPLNVEDNFEPRRHEDFAGASDAGMGSMTALTAAVARSRRVVIAVHGFNVPKWAAERLFLRLGQCLKGTSDDTVLIGYAWPSEAVLSNVSSGLYAAPPVAVGLALLATIVGWGLHVTLGNGTVDLILAGIGFVLLGCFAGLWLMRTLVYFRDLSRAINHGSPDLVHLVRELDRGLSVQAVTAERTRIDLSFVAHSMGALIAVSAIRSIAEFMEPASAGPYRVFRHFAFGQLVLVSPDIPVELIIPRRTNWLEASLTEFREVHMFSNEGDVVLKMISTVANYVMTPVRFWANGYRLGNMAVVRPPAGAQPFGVVNIDTPTADAESFLRRLRLGWFTVWERLDPIPVRGWLFDWFAHRARLDRRTAFATTISGATIPLPMRISYFDCTDSTDGTTHLTHAKNKAELSMLDNWQLLLDSALSRSSIDVHSGYFYGPITVKLIANLAARGLRDYETPEIVSSECSAIGIRVLLAPELLRRVRSAEGAEP